MTTDRERILEELRLAFEARPGATVGDVIHDAAREMGTMAMVGLSDRSLLLGLVQMRKYREEQQR